MTSGWRSSLTVKTTFSLKAKAEAVSAERVTPACAQAKARKVTTSPSLRSGMVHSPFRSRVTPAVATQVSAISSSLSDTMYCTPSVFPVSVSKVMEP